MKICIVEDYAATGESLQMALALKGHEAIWLASSLAAELRLCRTSEDGPEPFDAVVIDQMMPGMSGLELLQKMRAVEGRQTLPVVMATGLDRDALADMEARLDGLGPVEVLRKPFAPLELLEVIERLRVSHP